MARRLFPGNSTIAGVILSAASLPAPALAQRSIDLDHLTMTQAAADLCAGKITSKALTSAAIARAKASANLNAFITLDEAGAGRPPRHSMRGARRRAASRSMVFPS